MTTHIWLPVQLELMSKPVDLLFSRLSQVYFIFKHLFHFNFFSSRNKAPLHNPPKPLLESQISILNPKRQFVVSIINKNSAWSHINSNVIFQTIQIQNTESLKVVDINYSSRFARGSITTIKILMAHPVMCFESASTVILWLTWLEKK